MSDREIEEIDMCLEIFYEHGLNDFIKEYKLSKKSKEV
ncbi:hypothetical protein C826_02349 [Helicobacter bilis WiWa]|uniref:Uncharacterized protein n=1 Tax=Helicobacter bilis WiWa TaxID=1235804 RepID=N2BEQ7_9HELI|nr:hypothetical protein C826_02349 [Helicobacter bilis WiWa]